MEINREPELEILMQECLDHALLHGQVDEDAALTETILAYRLRQAEHEQPEDRARRLRAALQETRYRH